MYKEDCGGTRGGREGSRGSETKRCSNWRLCFSIFHQDAIPIDQIPRSFCLAIGFPSARIKSDPNGSILITANRISFASTSWIHRVLPIPWAVGHSDLPTPPPSKKHCLPSWPNGRMKPTQAHVGKRVPLLWQKEQKNNQTVKLRRVEQNLTPSRLRHLGIFAVVCLIGKVWAPRQHHRTTMQLVGQLPRPWQTRFAPTAPLRWIWGCEQCIFILDQEGHIVKGLNLFWPRRAEISGCRKKKKKKW